MGHAYVPPFPCIRSFTLTRISIEGMITKRAMLVQVTFDMSDVLYSLVTRFQCSIHGHADGCCSTNYTGIIIHCVSR
jgi:hypothetical protein